MEGTITVAYITDCPTITVHAAKCYKALINSGAVICHSDTQPTRTLRTVTRPPYNPLQLN